MIETFLNPEIIAAIWPIVLAGLWNTVLLSLIVVPLGLLGGLILNLMPCVFPVLSIKALALVQRGDHKAEGLAYTAGVLASFALLGAVLVALRAGGQQIGWGFQFHSPVFVYVVAVLLFLVALSLAGLLDIGSSLAGLGSGLAARQGWVGTFFTGVLAAVVATPCTAPFMGAAIAFAVAQPAAVLLAVLLALGLGLALPFLVLAFWPAAQRWLPRPGAWMETFRQFLAFPMLAAVVWLLWVLAQQAVADPDGEGPPGGDDLAVGPDAGELAQGHQHHRVALEAHHLGADLGLPPADEAHLAHPHVGDRGLDDQAGELHHPPPDPHQLGPLQQLQVALQGDRHYRGSLRASAGISTLRSISNWVRICPSMVPNSVWMMQPPGCTSASSRMARSTARPISSISRGRFSRSSLPSSGCTRSTSAAAWPAQ